MREERGRGGGGFEHASVQKEVLPEHDERGVCVQRVGERRIEGRSGRLLDSSIARSQVCPCDDERVEEKESVFCQECKKGGNAACVVEVLRVPDAARIEVHNHRRFPYNPIDERDPAWLAEARPAYASGDGGECTMVLVDPASR